MNFKSTNNIILIIFFVLFSCSDIKTEKDKYPDIPEFPKFKNGELKLVKKFELIARTDSTILNQKNYHMRKRFIVRDSTFFLITYLVDNPYSEEPLQDDKYYINLITIKDNKINHYNWIDNDFKINFEIDKNNDTLTVGKRKFFTKSNYYEYNSILNFKNFQSVDTIFHKEFFDTDCINDINFYNPNSFEEIIIDSKAKSTAEVNNAISVLSWKYEPVYLYYYKIRYKNKIGLTKVTDNVGPVFIKLKDDLYYIDQKYTRINNKTGIEKIIIYKIQ